MNINKAKKQAYDLFEQQKIPEANKALDKLCRVDKTDTELWLTAGIANGMLGEFDSAIKRFLHVIKLEPKHIDALMNLGLAYEQQSKNNEAIDCYIQALKYYPNEAGLHFRLGIVLDSDGQLKQAIAEYDQAIKLKPDYYEVYLNKGLTYALLDSPTNAIESFLVYKNHNDNDSINYHMGAEYFKLNDFEQALVCFKRSFELNSDKLPAMISYASVLMSVGDFDAAAKMYSNILAKEPNNVSALGASLFLGKENNTKEIVKNFEGLMQDGLSDEDKVIACFSLADYYDKEKSYEIAFKYYKTGNNLKRKLLEYKISDTEKDFNMISSTFNKGFITQHQINYDHDIKPVFVLGMPRSGTSLVEQILASHPEVFGAGEVNSIVRVLKNKYGAKKYLEAFLNLISDVTDKELLELGETYIKDIKKYAPTTKQYVVNKMPHNFMFIGLIKMMFPKAIIIVCERNPIDICWSIFKKNFFASHGYSNTLAELAEYYQLYAKLIAHWKSVFNQSDLYTINYERLTANPEPEIQTLIKHCGLNWEKEVLNFHTKKRVINTASFHQVRQKMYTSSVSAWEPYKKYLEPLLKLSP